MPRFVLLAHDHPTPHLDLLFEVGEVLWAWRLESWPDADTPRLALRNFDHRLIYLDYEGPINGGRGSVRRVEQGMYEWLSQSDDRLIADVTGHRLTGRVELTRGEGEVWQLTYQ